MQTKQSIQNAFKREFLYRGRTEQLPTGGRKQHTNPSNKWGEDLCVALRKYFEWGENSNASNMQRTQNLNLKKERKEIYTKEAATSPGRHPTDRQGQP